MYVERMCRFKEVGLVLLLASGGHCLGVNDCKKNISNESCKMIILLNRLKKVLKRQKTINHCFTSLSIHQ